MGSQRVRQDWATELNWTEASQNRHPVRDQELCFLHKKLGPHLTPGLSRLSWPLPRLIEFGLWAWGPRSCGPTSPRDSGPPSSLRGTVLRNSRLACSSPLIWLEDPKLQQWIQTFCFPLVTKLAALAGSSWVSLSFFTPWFWIAWLCTQ